MSQCHTRSSVLQFVLICLHRFSGISREEGSMFFFRIGGIDVERQTALEKKSNPSGNVVQAGSHRRSTPNTCTLHGVLYLGRSISHRLYGKNGIDIAQSLECFTPAASTFACSSEISLSPGRVWLVGETFQSFLFTHFPSAGKMLGFPSRECDFLCFFNLRNISITFEHVFGNATIKKR